MWEPEFCCSIGYQIFFTNGSPLAHIRKARAPLWWHMLKIAFKKPITRSLQLPHIVITAFSLTNLFLAWFISNSDPHRNLSDQMQSLAWTYVDLSKWCRRVHSRLHCFILTEACSCRLDLAYFAEKISKNRLACKNAIVFAYYGSCRLLVSGSCFCSFLKNRRILLFLWISKINVAFVKTFQESYLVDDLARTWFRKTLPVWAVSGVSVSLCKKITMQTTTWLKAWSLDR